jgi:hypothetical protein
MECSYDTYPYAFVYMYTWILIKQMTNVVKNNLASTVNDFAIDIHDIHKFTVKSCHIIAPQTRYKNLSITIKSIPYTKYS